MTSSKPRHTSTVFETVYLWPDAWSWLTMRKARRKNPENSLQALEDFAVFQRGWSINCRWLRLWVTRIRKTILHEWVPESSCRMTQRAAHLFRTTSGRASDWYCDSSNIGWAASRVDDQEDHDHHDHEQYQNRTNLSHVYASRQCYR